MKTRNTQHSPKSTHQHHRQRGSILLLVIGVLLLLMVLGTAYIQLVRKDRESVFNLSSSRRIGQVAQSAVDAVSARLKEDIVHDNDTPDNPRDDLFFSEIPATSPQGPQENYDYPGRFDRWLASTGPNSSSRWGQISLIGDRYAFLDLNSQLPNIPGSQTRHYNPPTVPIDEFKLQQNFQIFSTYQLLEVNANQVDNHTPAPQNINLNADNLSPQNEEFGILADADGDGFYDSIWEVAPISQMHGKRYFAAYRVIDNSSMVNAQVGLGAGNIVTGTPFPGSYDTWDTPAEVDFLRYMSFKSATGGGRNNPDGLPGGFATYIPYRSLNATVATGFVTPQLRKTFWQQAGRYTGQLDPIHAQNYNMLGIENELELRYRNGLNNENVTTTLESFFPNMLRANSPGEIAYFNLSTSVIWRSGLDSTGNYSGKLQTYYDNNPRIGITTVSGASTLVEPFQRIRDSISPQHVTEERRMAKSDLNKAILDEIYEQALLVYAQGMPYIHINGYDSAAFAKQFAVNVLDYRDTDNRITQYKDDNIYGMEALPFVTEIYSVQAYKAQNVSPSGDPMNPTGYNVQWGAEGTAGYAIEIHNPFGHAIKTENVFVEVNGQDLGELNTLSGADSIQPGKSIVLHKPAEGPEGDLSATFGDNVETMKDISTAIAPGVTIKVRLLVNSADENGGLKDKVPYASASMNQTHPPTHNETNVPLDPDPNSMTIYKQIIAKGNARGMNAMLIDGDNFQNNSRGPSHNIAFNPDYHSVGKVQKSNAAGDVVDPRINQLIFGRFTEADNAENLEGFALVGELAHLPIIGPNKNRTFAQMWTQLKDQSRDSGCMLNFDVDQAQLVFPSGNSGNYQNPIDNTQALPHAMLLLHRFSTLSPLHDLVDNDQDGVLEATDEDENFIPGLININTATEDVLASGLPWPMTKDQAQQTILRDFLNYRDNPQTRTKYRNSSEFYSGFASTGELFNINSFRYYGNQSGRDAEVGGVRINPKFGMVYGDDPDGDQVGDDREERTLAAQWLSQLGTVRSDIFTAYIIVRGYRTNEQVPRFKDAVEEVRLIVVLDRSPVRDGTGSVRVLGLYQY